MKVLSFFSLLFFLSFLKYRMGISNSEKDDFPFTRGRQLTSWSEGRRTVFMSSLQMTRRKVYSDTEFSSPMPGIDPRTSSSRGQYSDHWTIGLFFFFFFFFFYKTARLCMLILSFVIRISFKDLGAVAKPPPDFTYHISTIRFTITTILIIT